MANWMKITGIVFMVLGVLMVLTPVPVIPGYELDYTFLFVTWGVGVGLIALGAYLYYLGRKKERSLTSVPRPQN